MGVSIRDIQLFVGAGGGALGSILLGHSTVCAVEIDTYCREVVIQRQRDRALPRFPIWDDIRTFDATPWRGRVDLVSGGFPCLPFSKASRGRGTAPDLWPEMRRCVAEIEPTFVFAENVCSHAIFAAAQDLIGMGFSTKAICLSAQDVGADHVRKRFWLVGYADRDGEPGHAIHAEASRLPELRCSVWESYDGEYDVAYGMAHRMVERRAVGNGQVPIVAALAWSMLIKAHREDFQ